MGMYVRKADPAGNRAERAAFQSIIEHNSMPADRIEGALAVVAVLCVLTIFLFPAMEGPYCAVHGPVTALLSIRASATLRLRMLRSGLTAPRNRLHRTHPAQARFVPSPLSFMESAADDLAASGTSILRC
jgi:hypothetical protein